MTRYWASDIHGDWLTYSLQIKSKVSVYLCTVQKIKGTHNKIMLDIYTNKDRVMNGTGAFRNVNRLHTKWRLKYKIPHMLVSIPDVWGATRWCQMDFNTMFHFISVRHDPGETQDPLGQCRVWQWVRGFHLDISWQSGCGCLACSRCIPPWICIPRSSLTNWSSSWFYKPCLSHLLRFNLRSSVKRAGCQCT